MKNKLNQLIPVLEYINKLTKKDRSYFLKGANPDLILGISEICYNVNKGNVEGLNHSHIKKLKPYKTQIQTLSLKKPSIKQCKNLIQKGGFLATLLSTVLPILLGVILSKRK